MTIPMKFSPARRRDVLLAIEARPQAERPSAQIEACFNVLRQIPGLREHLEHDAEDRLRELGRQIAATVADDGRYSRCVDAGVRAGQLGLLAQFNEAELSYQEQKALLVRLEKSSIDSIRDLADACDDDAACVIADNLEDIEEENRLAGETVKWFQQVVGKIKAQRTTAVTANVFGRAGTRRRRRRRGGRDPQARNDAPVGRQLDQIMQRFNERQDQRDTAMKTRLASIDSRIGALEQRIGTVERRQPTNAHFEPVHAPPGDQPVQTASSSSADAGTSNGPATEPVAAPRTKSEESAAPRSASSRR